MSFASVGSHWRAKTRVNSLESRSSHSSGGSRRKSKGISCPPPTGGQCPTGVTRIGKLSPVDSRTRYFPLEFGRSRWPTLDHGKHLPRPRDPVPYLLVPRRAVHAVEASA